MRKFLFILILLGTFISSQARDGYNIEVTAPQLANDSIFLASYYNGKIFSIDTLALNKKGTGFFSKEKSLDEGLYMIYLSSERHYDFIIGTEQNIKLTLDTAKISLKATGAPQTENFIAFGEFMTNKRKEQIDYRKKLEENKDNESKKKTINEKITSLDKEVYEFQNTLGKQFKGKTLGVFIKSLIAPEFPDSLRKGDMEDKDFQMTRYQYAKNHYWDNIELSDTRIWRMNFMHKKLDEYTQHIIIRHPDSITEAAIALIEKTKRNDEPYIYDKEKRSSYELMVNYMINFAVTSKIMGMDKLLVTLADKYYYTGNAPWADSTLISNISAEVKKVRHNLIGLKAANLPLIKYDGNRFNLHDIKSTFTLVYFFEPTCGHCKETTPKLYNDIYLKYKSKGFEVISIYTMTDKKEWKEFIEKHKLYHWVNAWDPNRQSYYWKYFDTSTTPGVYLLDKDKKIIAKKINVESLDKILDMELLKEKE